MVSIFTYRDERKLFALIGAVIVAALIALVQVDAARQGRISPLSTAATSLAALFEIAVGTASNATRHAFDAVVATPRLYDDNVKLRAEVQRLRQENAQLDERLNAYGATQAAGSVAARNPRSVVARVVGYDPENTLRVVTIDRGTRAGVARDDGVLSADGVVGRVVEAGPFTSKVLLITDYTSSLPAVVGHGRWWGIAKGTLSRVKLQYIAQDARLHRGDTVVTGEGRSFHSGVPIGRIYRVEEHNEGSLYQTAIVEPAVAFGRLDRVIVVPK